MSCAYGCPSSDESAFDELTRVKVHQRFREDEGADGAVRIHRGLTSSFPPLRSANRHGMETGECSRSARI